MISSALSKKTKQNQIKGGNPNTLHKRAADEARLELWAKSRKT
jgi:hypothetical protein